MRKSIAFIFVILFLLQFSFFPALIGRSTNLILLLLIVVALRKSFFESLCWAILMGGLFDAYSFAPWGVGLISFFLVVFFVDIFYKIALSDEKNIFSLVMIFSLGKIIFDSSFYFFTRLMVYYGQDGLKAETWSLSWAYGGDFFIFVFLGILVQRLVLFFLQRIGHDSSKLILQT